MPLVDLQAEMTLVADAVAARLTEHAESGVFSQPVSVERTSVPESLMPTLAEEGIKLVVSPTDIEVIASSRGRERYDYEIETFVLKKLMPINDSPGFTDQAEVDDLVKLSEEVGDALRVIGGKPLPEMPEARFVEFRHEPIYSPEDLSKFRVFFSALILRFSNWRNMLA